jgi:hypothetical protein
MRERNFGEEKSKNPKKTERRIEELKKGTPF